MSPKVKEFLVTILFGTIVCAIVGVIIYGITIFKMNDMRFVILLYGFYGSVFFGMLNYLKLREQIAVIVFVIFLTILIRGKTTHPILYLRDVYLLLPLFLSIYLYKIFINKYSTVPIFLRGLSLVLIYPIFYITALMLLILILGVNFISALSSLIISFRISIIVAFGLAIGFDLYEKYKIKINSFVKVV